MLLQHSAPARWWNWMACSLRPSGYVTVKRKQEIESDDRGLVGLIAVQASFGKCLHADTPQKHGMLIIMLIGSAESAREAQHASCATRVQRRTFWEGGIGRTATRVVKELLDVRSNTALVGCHGARTNAEVSECCWQARPYLSCCQLNVSCCQL